MSPDDPRHGTYAGGRVHRKANQPVCDPCARAEARYEQARQLDILNGRPRTVPNTGTRRRIQALVALGHSFARIGEALDMTGAGAWTIAHRAPTLIQATTATKVTSLYDAWSMTLPPAENRLQRKAASYARTVARRHSWPPPLAWDDIDHDQAPANPARSLDDVDEAVVRRILDGDPTPARAATTAERRAVLAAWNATGRPIRQLAEMTGWKTERYAVQEAA